MLSNNQAYIKKVGIIQLLILAKDQLLVIYEQML